MTDKMRDAWINCQRLSRVCVYVCVCVTKLHSSYADACRTLESWRRNRRRETEGAKRGKAEVNHATPVTTSVRWQTSTVDVTAQEVEATSDNDLNRIKARPPRVLPRDPPPVVIASLMSWENHLQLQINRFWPKLLSSAGRWVLDIFSPITPAENCSSWDKIRWRLYRFKFIGKCILIIHRLFKFSWKKKKQGHL